jgi:flagellar hook protein FlgE
VPITTFTAPDSLQSQNGQAFTATVNSGNPITQAEGTNGAGSLLVGSVESSNVDIAAQFSALIIAQQAYGANAKVVTTANQLLQTTINMIQ